MCSWLSPVCDCYCDDSEFFGLFIKGGYTLLSSYLKLNKMMVVLSKQIDLIMYLYAYQLIRCELNKIKQTKGKTSIEWLYPFLKLTENQTPNPHPTPTPPPPQRGITFSQPNHVRSSSNFQDIFLTIYQHDLWCQMSPHPPRPQSGTLNVLQVPNWGFLSQIMSDLDQTFRIGP